jgi:hypothetical protein
MSGAKILISHSHKDEQVARSLKEAFNKNDIHAWTYEADLPFGNEIMTEIEQHMNECDYVLVILSDSSRHSEWVGRELGLALELQKKRKVPHPAIVGVRCDSPCESFMFDALDYRTGQSTRTSYDFSTVRCFSLCSTQPSDKLDDLVQYFLPKVTFITEDEGEQRRLLWNSFECYKDLFPDESERDEPADIVTWLDEARRATLINSPWREVYAVLHIGDQAIGMASLSAQVQRHWSFGNYLGVRSGWRQKHRAEYFIEEVIRHLRIISPSMKGILFEVEPVDIKLLERVADRPNISGFGDENEVFLNLRSLRRLLLYHSYKAVALLSSDGLPLPYWQPSMVEGELDSRNERELILMITLFEDIDKEKIELQELLEFIYDDLYGDAYGGAGAVEIPNYRAYVAQIKSRVQDRVSDGWKLDKVKIPPKVKRLLSKAKGEGLMDELAL